MAYGLWPMASARVPHTFKHRNLMDLRRLEVVPHDAPRPVVRPLHLDHGPRRGHQVDGDVVPGDHQVLAHDLDRVDGGGHDGAAVDLSRLRQEPVLEVGEAAALPDPRALEIDGHGAREDEVKLGNLLEIDHTT